MRGGGWTFLYISSSIAHGVRWQSTPNVSRTGAGIGSHYGVGLHVDLEAAGPPGR